MKKLILLLFTMSCLFNNHLKAQNELPRFIVKGKIIDETTQKSTGVIPVKIIEFNRVVESNENGEFIFNMPKGNYTIEINEYPYIKNKITLNLISDTTINILLKLPEGMRRLKDVTVLAKKKVSNELSGITKINSSDIRGLPTMIGESDILKTLSLSSGVTSSGEGAADMQVRGGLHGQNLYLLDGIPLYSTQHMFGMVSVYNPIFIKSVELYKSGFPAEFGGRISSVIDVKSKDPDLERRFGEAELNLFTSKAAINIPVIKNKLGISLAGRISNYSILNLLSAAQLLGETETGIHFGDLSTNVLFQVTEKDAIKFSFFYNSDGLSILQNSNTMTDKSWQSNKQEIIKLNWDRKISENISNSLQLFSDRYNYNFGTASGSRSTPNPEYYEISNGSESIGIENKLSINVNKSLLFDAGLLLKNYRFLPMNISTSDTSLTASKFEIGNQEFCTYLQSKYQLTTNHSINTGIRLAYFGNTETSYLSAEPRFAYMGKLSKDFSINATLSKMTQNIHRIANQGIGMPLELFISSDSYLHPEESWIYSLGVAKDTKFAKSDLTFKADLWYKDMNDIVEFKDGYDAISILLSDNVLTNDNSSYLTQGRGLAYGIDLSSSIAMSKLSLTADYTLMKAMNQFDDLNHGNWYASSTDIRHSLTLTSNLKLKKGWSFNAIWQFRSGRPVTLPLAVFPVSEIDFNSGEVIFSNELNSNDQAFQFVGGERNNVRLRPFHKLDISFNHNYLIKSKYQAMFSFGLYNVYNRANPAYYFIDQKKVNNSYYPVLKSISLFPVMPSFSWNIKF